ncbi:zinc-ribbon domain-containing protein [Pedomonas mirosovicensis]|uniref:zinc-ribbon domain-containing protein n=1 Tax=Pedomonas mirosovicensis TaxID=2908641 RepID=UPI002168B80C|nr:MJ0042-type zinc finger domain-containing protein [Pedomonas mirosovicensis]MCH8684966.1 zinc-ribbon domain-containing protein [Pedomonas mirosovicensis]
MILTCPNCNSRYLVSDTAIPVGGRAVRCAACKHVWTEYPAETPARELEAVGAPADAMAGAQAGSAAPDLADEAAPAYPKFAEGPIPRLGDEAAPMADAFEDPAPMEGSTRALRRRIQADESRQTRRSRKPKRRFPVKWVAIGTGVVAVLALNVFLWKDALIEHSDMFRSFYAAAGLATPVPHDASLGAQVLRISYPPPPPARLLENGNLSQEITGSIENPTTRTVRIPSLKGTMLDENGNVVFSWVFPPPTLVLNGGQTVMFDTTVENFPRTARQLRIGFETGADTGTEG